MAVGLTGTSYMLGKFQAHARLVRGAIAAALFVSAPTLALTATAAPRDAIDLSQASVYNSPSDIASWPVTTAITRLDMHRPNGLTFAFSAQNTWPDYVPPGWSGGLQFTVWAVVKINGHWYTSGFVQMWRGRVGTGAPILTDFARNWAYDSRWGPMRGHQPVVGEQMGFFVSAGDARGVNRVTSVRQRSNVVLVSLPANDTGVFTYPDRGVSLSPDYDGDGHTDIAVYRPSAGAGYILQSGSGTTAIYTGGLVGDIPVSGDFDGDGRTDAAGYRPSTGTWFMLHSGSGQVVQVTWGAPGDIPVPGDFDGDGKTDIAVFRPSTGVWYIIGSTASVITRTWGAAGDIPVTEDFDGDGKADIAVYRPSTGIWWVLMSSTGTGTTYAWGGAPGDIPVPGDYDGDGKADVAVYRPSNGIWYVILSTTAKGATGFWGGAAGDIPVPGDYDGDGRTDIAIFRPSTGAWFVINSRTWTPGTYNWGVNGDIPIPMRP
jgi:VCBS repeat protein/FG-GAP repeat protein